MLANKKSDLRWSFKEKTKHSSAPDSVDGAKFHSCYFPPEFTNGVPFETSLTFIQTISSSILTF